MAEIIIDGSGAAHGLGRLPSPADPRDQLFSAPRLFSIVEVRADKSDPYQKWYSEVWNGDQGNTGRCTAFSLLHVLHDGPFTHRPYWAEQGRPHPLMDPWKLYRQIQCLDPWGCRSIDDGSTMRAVGDAARKLGLAENYYWFTTVDQALDYLATRGPILLGTWWRQGMNVPKRAPGEPSDGMVTYTGPYLGGHAFKADEINWTHEYIGFKNSWGLSWGDKGRFRMSFKDFEQMFAEDGEILALTEKRQAA